MASTDLTFFNIWAIILLILVRITVKSYLNKYLVRFSLKEKKKKINTSSIIRFKCSKRERILGLVVQDFP